MQNESTDTKFVRNKSSVLALALYASTSLASLPVWADETVVQTSSEIDFAADQLTYDADTGEIHALGNVVITREGYKLVAGDVRYNEKTGMAVATGAVEFTTPDGNKIVAPRIVLEDVLKRAFVEDIRLIMADGAQVAAASGSRNEEQGLTTLDRAVYSPCKVCAEDPDDKPIWQIKAVKVVHDQNKRRLKYDDATLEILGVPILWLPSLSHPDPTVDRASGFLPATLSSTKELGVVASLPYYHVFDETSDFTLTPYITTKERPFLEAEFRKHFGFAKINISGSGTYTDKRDVSLLASSKEVFRGHFALDTSLQHNENWRSLVDVNWASDDTYMRRYNFSEVDTLMSQYKLEGFYGRSYISARMVGFQGLRQEDVSGLTAYALPLIDAEFIPKWQPLGGTISIRGNALALKRSAGSDSQRLSISSQWKKRWIMNSGLVFDADALARVEGYNFEDTRNLDDPNYINLIASGSSWRQLAYVSGTLSMPFVKISNKSTHTIEPIIELTVSPNTESGRSIVNEDSRSFEINDLNVFSTERASGYDLWQSGSRATYGIKYRYSGKDLRGEFMLGHSLRFSTIQFYSRGMGMEGDSSDIVGRLNLQYKDWLDIEHRFRLDDVSLGFRRNEFNIGIKNKTAGLNAHYLDINRELRFINREDREEIRLSGYYKLNDNWRVDAFAIQDLTDGFVQKQLRDGFEGIEYGGGVTYLDECIEVSLSARRTFTQDRDIIPGTSILFRLKLRNLG